MSYTQHKTHPFLTLILFLSFSLSLWLTYTHLHAPTSFELMRTLAHHLLEQLINLHSYFLSDTVLQESHKFSFFSIPNTHLWLTHTRTNIYTHTHISPALTLSHAPTPTKHSPYFSFSLRLYHRRFLHKFTHTWASMHAHSRAHFSVHTHTHTHTLTRPRPWPSNFQRDRVTLRKESTQTFFPLPSFLSHCSSSWTSFILKFNVERLLVKNENWASTMQEQK